MKKLYSYDSLCFLPSSEAGTIISRKTPIRVEFCGWTFYSPVIPANMECTIDYLLARELSELGFFYILHRFYPVDEIRQWVKISQSLRCISISVGVQECDRETIQWLCDRKLTVHFITIDVAHGHHDMVQDMVLRIRDKLPSTKIIMGNIGTPQAAIDAARWGADAVKAGIAGGKACTTYQSTGIMTPMYSTVQNICDASPIQVIADGGIRQPGHVSLALNAGASMVMVGSMFAKCKDSPAKLSEDGNEKFFYGSASVYNGRSSHIEGTGIWLDKSDMSYTDLLNSFNEGIQSTLSYLNLTSIEQLNGKEVYEIA